MTAVSAGIGAALLMAANTTPAGANPFEYRPGASSFYRSAPAQAERIAFRSRGGGENRKEESRDHGAGDEILAKGKGPWSVLISIDKQQLTLYSGDQPVAHSKVSTGTASHPTPTGVFSIIQRNRWHRSNLYGNAPMWFMQRITWSGVAMHQGVVPGYPASHGCIRLPEAFARQLWGITQHGRPRDRDPRRNHARRRSRTRSCSCSSARRSRSSRAGGAAAISTLPSADDSVKSAYNTLETTAQRGASKPACA